MRELPAHTTSPMWHIGEVVEVGVREALGKPTEYRNLVSS